MFFFHYCILCSCKRENKSSYSPEKSNQMFSRLKFPRQWQSTLHIRQKIPYEVSIHQTRHQDLHQHNIQNATSFVNPPHHLGLYKNKPLYKGVFYYNHLPSHLRKHPIMTFKTAQTRWLLDRPYYNEKEFLPDNLTVFCNHSDDLLYCCNICIFYCINLYTRRIFK